MYLLPEVVILRNPLSRLSVEHDCTCCGNQYHICLDSRYDDQGHLELFQSGKDDIQLCIDSYLPSTDFSGVIRRIMNGETPIPNDSGAYGDFTSLPTNLADVLNLVNNSHSAWERLPAETRLKFDNNINYFLSSAGSPDWAEKLGFAPDPAPDLAPVPDLVPDGGASNVN